MSIRSVWALGLGASLRRDGLHGLCWAIHGLSTSPWHDNWMGSNSLRNLLVGPLSSSEDKLMVSDLLLGNGVVDVSRLSFVIPDPLL